MAPVKNILLVNPWIYDFTAYDFWLKPLGLLTVAALLEARPDVRLSFIDCLDRFHPGLDRPAKGKADGRGPFPKQEVPKPGVLSAVPRRWSRYGIPVRLFEEELARVPRPDAVLLTCTMTYWYPGVQAVADIVRRRFGGVPIVLGGIYAALCPEHAGSHSGADVVAAGPAETSLPAALEKVFGGGFRAPSGPDGFASLPRPAFARLRDRTWLPVLGSRGCPFRCTFCASSLLSERFERRRPESVAAEIVAHHDRFGTDHFAFYDDALLVDKDRHAAPLLRLIAEAGRPIRLHTPNGLHLREIDGGLARLFRAAGMTSLYLSLESSDESLLRERAPKTVPGDLPRALEALEAAGYARRDVGVYLITGLPGQSLAGVEESVRAVRGLGATPRLAFFSPIPGTAEWGELARRGVVAAGADPLLHNKIAFAYLKGDFAPADFERLRKIAAD